jgi:hypothetical protein
MMESKSSGEGHLTISVGSGALLPLGEIGLKLESSPIKNENVVLLGFDMGREAVAEVIRRKMLSRNQIFQPLESVLNRYRRDFPIVAKQLGLYKNSETGLMELSTMLGGEGARRDRRKAMVYINHPRVKEQYKTRLMEIGHYFQDLLTSKLSDSARVPIVNVYYLSTTGGGFGSGSVNEIARITKHILEELGLGLRQWLILMGTPRKIDLADKELIHSQLSEYFLIKDILYLQTKTEPTIENNIDEQGNIGPLYNGVYIFPLKEASPNEYANVNQQVRDFVLSKILMPSDSQNNCFERVLPIENYDNAIRQSDMAYCQGKRTTWGSFKTCHLTVPSELLKQWNQLNDELTALSAKLDESNSEQKAISQTISEMTFADYTQIDTPQIQVWYSGITSEANNKLYLVKQAVTKVATEFEEKSHELRSEAEKLEVEKKKYDDNIRLTREKLAQKNEFNFFSRRNLNRALENYEAVQATIQDKLLEKQGRSIKLQKIVNEFTAIRASIQNEIERSKSRQNEIIESLKLQETNLAISQLPGGSVGYQLPFKRPDLQKFREVFWLNGITNINAISLNDIGNKVFGENRYTNIIRNAFENILDAPIEVSFCLDSKGDGARNFPVEMVNIVSGEANSIKYIRSILQSEVGLSGNGEFGIGWVMAQSPYLDSSIYITVDFAGIPIHQINDFSKLEALYDAVKENFPNLLCYPNADQIRLSFPTNLQLRCLH